MLLAFILQAKAIDSPPSNGVLSQTFKEPPKRSIQQATADIALGTSLGVHAIALIGRTSSHAERGHPESVKRTSDNVGRLVFQPGNRRDRLSANFGHPEVLPSAAQRVRQRVFRGAQDREGSHAWPEITADLERFEAKQPHATIIHTHTPNTRIRQRARILSRLFWRSADPWLLTQGSPLQSFPAVCTPHRVQPGNFAAHHSDRF